MKKIIQIEIENCCGIEKQVSMLVDEIIDISKSFVDFLNDLEQEETEECSCSEKCHEDEDDLDSLPIAKKV